MSDAPQVRRVDKLMPEERCREMIARAYCGRLATEGPDGCPYIVPLLHVWRDGEIQVEAMAGDGQHQVAGRHTVGKAVGAT